MQLAQNTTTAPTAGPASAAPSPEPSFEELLKGVLPRAYQAALHLTNNSADAEDAVQEAALNAFRAFASFQPGTNFKAWFLKIVRNVVYMEHRRRTRSPDTTSIDAVPDLFLFSRLSQSGFLDRSPDPAADFMRRLTVEQVSAALADLPDSFRDVAVLYFVEDLSYQEIATIVNVPLGTVRSRLHRARALLQKALWTLAEESGNRRRR